MSFGAPARLGVRAGAMAYSTNFAVLKFYELRLNGVLRSSRGSTVGGLHLFVHFQSRKGASAADRVNGAYSAHRVYTWSILCVERHRIGFLHEEMSRLWCEC